MNNPAGNPEIVSSSDIPRLPRSTLPRPANKPSSSRVPVQEDLHIPRSRLRAPRDVSILASGSTSVISEPSAQNESLKRLDFGSTAPETRSKDDETQENSRGLSLSQEKIFKPISTPIVRRRPRPSLSERTIETLSQIPPSPSPQRRKSGFNPTERPLSSLSRPASSLSHSHSGALLGQYPPPLSTPRAISPNKHDNQLANGTRSVKPESGRRSVTSFPRSLPRSSIGSFSVPDTTPSKVPPVPKLPSAQALGLESYQPPQAINSEAKRRGHINQSDSKNAVTLNRGFMQNAHPNGAARSLSKPGYSAKTFTMSSSRQRPALSDVFMQPSLNASNLSRDKTKMATRSSSATATAKSHKEQSKTYAPKIKISNVFKESQSVATFSNKSPSKNSPKSSAALRETIAKAKAAKRAASKSGETTSEERKGTHQVTKENVLFEDEANAKNILSQRLNIARTSGKLNIAALGLTEFPKEVNDMYNLENIESTGSEWYESVDLTRLVAADNELEIIDDWVFPDISVSAARDLDEDFGGNIFQGLETLDLHGNQLSELPNGLQQLQRLKTLNLSKNRLSNNSLKILGQILSLRELRLSENNLDGACLKYLKHLNHLEILDLHDNAVSDLSIGISELLSLRILLVAGNKLTSIPFELLQSLPLTELDASKNKLGGILIPRSVNSLATFKFVDVSYNGITSISENETVDFSCLEILNVAENRLVSIPNISGWKSLVTLSAGGNNITSIPEGLTSLQRLRSLDLTRNSLKRLDNNIGLMDSLTVLLVANNPLRERRHLSMQTEDLKQELRDRALPVEPKEVVEGPAISVLQTPPLTVETWPVKPGGIVDRSSTKLEELESSGLKAILHISEIKTLILHHNLFSHIPATIDLISGSLTTLDLSHNKLIAETYILHPISLPNLKSLNLSSNSLSSLTPLTTLLCAPSLSTLSISYNRLPSLPALRTTYPSLNTINVANNNLTEIDVEAVQGLEVLDVSGNSIGHLDPRLGLLADEGLRTLLVGANVFRVPRREVVEMGTGALLAWLKGRIPVEELEK